MKKIKIITTALIPLVAIGAMAPLAIISSCAKTNYKVSEQAHKLYEAALDNFKKICEKPHSSFALTELETWIKQTVGAKIGSANVYQDAYGNIWYDLPASQGMENAKNIILQGHMDMVWNVVPGSGKDAPGPVDWVITKDKDGRDIMHSRDYLTTLGADDGVFGGIALALTLDNSFKHGPIRVIFTADEEPGLIGAGKLGIMPDGHKETVINSDYLLNLDSGTEGHAIVACSGGYSHKYTIKNFEGNISSVTNTDVVAHIHLADFQGGHSGSAIGRGRVNPLKLAAKVLKDFDSVYQLCSISTTTSVTNAIPVDGDYYVVLDNNESFDTLSNAINQAKTKLHTDYPNETKAKIEISKVNAGATDRPTKYLSQAASIDIINFIDDLLYGPITYLDEEHKKVESSSNVAPVSLNIEQTGTDAKPQFSLSIYSRSLNKTLHKIIGYYQNGCYKRLEEEMAKSSITSKDDIIAEYPPFEYKKDNAMYDMLVRANNKIGIKTSGYKVSSGDECAWWQAFNPNIQQLCAGPTMTNLHLPTETLYLDTYERLCQTVLNVFEEMSNI